MNEFKTKAIDTLQTFPESEYKTALMALIQYTIERNK